MSDDAIDVTDDSSGAGVSLEEQLEDTLSTLEMVTAERDGYLEAAQRVQADFENYKRRVETQRVEHRERATESLVADLLPVLDACDAAVAHGAADVAPLQAQLSGLLVKGGLTRVDEIGVPFDPNIHDAVMSEPSDDPADVHEVVEVLRAGYLWNTRVLRPAMVKVKG